MYKRRARGWMKHIDFILCDMMMLLLAFVLSYAVRFGVFEGQHWSAYSGYAVILMVVDLLACVLFNPMHNVLKRGYYREWVATVKHASIVFAFLMTYLFTVKSGIIYSRIVLCLTTVLHVFMGYGFRLLYKNLLRKQIVRERQRSILVVAPERTAASIVKKLSEDANGTLKVTGLVLTDRNAAGEEIAGVPVVVNLCDAATYVCREWVDEVFLDDTNAKEKTADLSEQVRTMGVALHEYIALERHLDQKQFIENLGGFMVLTSSVNYTTPLQAMFKRLMDIAGGLVGCLIAIGIIAAVGPKIRKASPGPILYSQERIGRNGKKFKFYKIRSMYLDADERKKELMAQNRVADGMMFKLDFDPRIIGNEILPDGTKKTGIGAFIRNTSLDEFPQFFNVLKGDMSLVGTRPPTVDEWEKYEPHHRARMAMRPGITGMWQVSGRSSITDFEEIVKLDTQYILNWNIGLDIKILLKTVLAVLHKDGAM